MPRANTRELQDPIRVRLDRPTQERLGALRRSVPLTKAELTRQLLRIGLEEVDHNRSRLLGPSSSEGTPPR